MSFLWTANELVSIMRARPVGHLPEGIGGISIDSRTIEAGEAFFAIKGDRFDGHDYVVKAMHAGAALAVVAEEKLVAFGHVQLPLLVVSNVLEALEVLAKAARARSQARIIAVTGSVGKTTTKEMLRTVLSPSGMVHVSPASFNNHWGVPLTLSRMPAEAAYGVFEIGMNHPGEITPLVKLVRPHVAIITAVAAAHLGAFRDVNQIAQAKAEIFAGLEAGGVALLNRDDRRYKLLHELAWEAGVKKIMSFGTRRRADFRAMAVRPLADCTVVDARIGEESVTYKIGAPGVHLVTNSLAVLGTVSLVGANLAKAALAMASVQAEKGRGRRHLLSAKNGRFTLIDESYNANPTSVGAAIALLAISPIWARGRRIAVLGDMLELGNASERLHKSLKRPLETGGVDLVFLVGPQMRALAREIDPSLLAGHYASAAEVEAPLIGALRPGDVVMVKASLGTKFTPLVEALMKACPPVSGNPVGDAGNDDGDGDVGRSGDSNSPTGLPGGQLTGQSAGRATG
ncbi:MAG: UDP-N-acetylmuramoylalanyl-D-glutamyl-2,6-diaminopimelate--D-alanyl-D-alanine ligase [Salaquimonas sp.]|nr:UDP-N-acetylmuramoylalanyl-D-glutamyl-2,6-diaminopimelate--D-alanyl-D-alanine ligase [Salaquimonas sp.]